MMKKISDKKLDDIFSRVVRLLADGKCEKCGEYVGYAELDCSHYHSRSMKTVRWNLKNVAAICGSCHRKFHLHPGDHTEWFKKRLGSEEYEKLDILAHMTIKEHPIDREKLYANLKDALKHLE
jgi:5-methylcytosine-specific restriction endonuclease McrA